MNFGLRLENFRIWLKQSCASIRRAISSMRLSNVVFPTPAVEENANRQPAQSAPQEPAATFFDAEFLKKIERLRLVAKRLSWAGARGEHAVSRKGFSLEFSDYRNYQPGDDLRYVDWNIYRRLERLLVKVFTAEEEMNIYFLVDTSRR
jgi:uncharacterized protein (DUF58 family)